METKENISVQESIKIINEMIETARNNVSDNSFHYLLWGWLVLIASAADYYLLSIGLYTYHWLPWPVMMGSGGIVAFVYHLFQKRREQVKTHVGAFLGHTWVSVMIALFLTLFIGAKSGQEVANPVIMVLYGMGLFISGRTFRFVPLVIGSIFCWGCAMVACYVRYDTQLILLGLSVLSGYIIPGYILKLKYKNETVQRA
jgi:hypothetical protein